MEVEFEVRPARETGDDPWSVRLEMIIAVLLGVAAITAAFAAFRSEQLKSESSTALYAGQLAETKFVAHNNTRTTQQIVDQDQFLAWHDAWRSGDSERASQIRELMSANLAQAVDVYAAERSGPQLPYTDPQEVFREAPWDPSQNLSLATRSPLSTTEYLTGLGKVEKDAKLLRDTEELSNEGLHLSERADDYARVAIVIATALFLYGIAAVSRRRQVKVTALVIGVVVYGTAVVALVAA